MSGWPRNGSGSLILCVGFSGTTTESGETGALLRREHCEYLLRLRKLGNVEHHGKRFDGRSHESVMQIELFGLFVQGMRE